MLHTADVHLGIDGYGTAAQQDEHQERHRRAFRRVIDRAIADRVDLVLIAGDLFDHNRVPDETVIFAREELERLARPVVVLPGNHDSLYTNAIHDRHDIAAGLGHVHVIRKLDGEVVDLPELDALVWGRAMEEHVPGWSPLANLPARDDGRWCVAMGHGFFYETRQPPDRSSPIFADEIRDSGWDYVALGHQHVQTDVSQGGVRAFYSGAPATHEGEDATVLHVEFSEAHGIRVTARPIC